MPKAFEGIFPPITTPFHEDGAVAYDRLAQNIEAWNKTDLSGYVVLGSNGEFVHLTLEEKLKVAATVVQSAGEDKRIILGTGCDSARETVDLTERTAKLGVHAAIVVTPYFYKGKMEAGPLIRYFEEVADRSPIPIILYNVPANTGVNMAVSAAIELTEHPNIVGMKDSSGLVAQIGEVIGGAPSDFSVFAGSAGFLLPALVLGAAGGIVALANIAPEECVRLYRLAQEGQYEKAKDLQLRLIPINRAVTATYGVPGLKKAMDMTGCYGGPPRAPLYPLADAQTEALQAILAKSGLWP